MESAAVSNKPTHKLVRRKACLQNFSMLEGLEKFQETWSTMVVAATLVT